MLPRSWGLTPVCLTFPNKELVSQLDSGQSLWLCQDNLTQECLLGTSHPDNLNFKRNIKYLICRSLLETKTTFFCQCQREKKLNLPSEQWNSQAQIKSNFFLKRILSLKNLSRGSHHEPPTFAMPLVWKEIECQQRLAERATGRTPCLPEDGSLSAGHEALMRAATIHRCL